MAKDKPATEIELEELQDLYLKDDSVKCYHFYIELIIEYCFFLNDFLS